MKILIGTKNQGKIEGAKQAFEKFYTNAEMIGIPVDSDVSDEPVNDEIYQGASNRVNNLIKYAKENNIDADFFYRSRIRNNRQTRKVVHHTNRRNKRQKRL